MITSENIADLIQNDSTYTGAKRESWINLIFVADHLALLYYHDDYVIQFSTEFPMKTDTVAAECHFHVDT